MTDLAKLRAAAQVVEDEQGNKLVRVPLKVWVESVDETDEEVLKAFQREQAKNIKALLDEWEQQPDDTPPGWWDEFRQFLRENRAIYSENDLNRIMRDGFV